MLILSRKTHEHVLIDGNIRVHVLGIDGGRVRLGFEAPREIAIVRAELERHSESADHGHVTLNSGHQATAC